MQLFSKLLSKIYMYLNLTAPKPHSFVNYPLQSTMVDVAQIAEIASNISVLLPDLNKFINEFNNFMISNSLNVSFEADDSMAISAPSAAHDKFHYFETKLKIIDRLVITHTNDIDSLIKKGLSLEQEIRKTDPTYTSQILDKVNEFKALKAKYPGQIKS